MGEWGDKRKRVLALLKDGKPNGAPAMEIARKAEVAPQYVYRIMDDEAERLAVAHLLPKDGSLPDDLPLRAVKHMIPTRAWNGLMKFGGEFEPDAPLSAVRKTPDKDLLAIPQIGRKAATLLRARVGYSADYPPGAMRLL